MEIRWRSGWEELVLGSLSYPRPPKRSIIYLRTWWKAAKQQKLLYEENGDSYESLQKDGLFKILVDETNSMRGKPKNNKSGPLLGLIVWRFLTVNRIPPNRGSSDRIGADAHHEYGEDVCGSGWLSDVPFPQHRKVSHATGVGGQVTPEAADWRPESVIRNPSMAGSWSDSCLSHHFCGICLIRW